MENQALIPIQNIPPQLQAMLQSMGGQSRRPEEDLYDPNLLHTREQLRTLLELTGSLSNLTQKCDRNEEADPEENPYAGIPFPIQTPMVQEAITGVILHASNRINTILQDDCRWKALPAKKSREVLKENLKTKLKEAKRENKSKDFDQKIHQKVTNAKVGNLLQQIQETPNHPQPEQQEQPEQN